jgi:mRNA-degrading endonuclease RelE of RelBE toxin-antitoxin system
MRYALVLSPEAARQYRRLAAFLRAQVRDALERHLRYEPTKTSRSRIKRLRGVARPQYRLRVGEIRVYYDVTGSVVEILAVIPKSDAGRWLTEAGESE